MVRSDAAPANDYPDDSADVGAAIATAPKHLPVAIADTLCRRHIDRKR